jgi:6-phosphogluconate dehydrogenase
MQIAIFGLGKMGMQIAKRLHKNNFDVLAWNRSDHPRHEFENHGGKTFVTEEELVEAMSGDQRIFWIMLPNDVVEDFIFSEKGLKQYFREGDIVIDGGNSFYKDSIRRAEVLKSQGVYYFDSGTSGGVWGEENGFALMVGGPSEVWPTIEPIFKTLSSGINYGLVGPSGAGHFVKMVHNGIEYGMMEAIAEGYSVMKSSPYALDLAQVTRIYQVGSVVRSWLIDLMANIYQNEDIEGTSGLVKATGEGEWTVNAGKEFGVDVRVIEDSLQVRRESELTENQDLYRNKILALLRKQFGGHGITKK